MARPPKQDRDSIATDTLTLRLSPDDRGLLDRLVAQRAAELAEEGIDVTAASFVRGLIRREAKARGLLDAGGGDAKPGDKARTPPEPEARPIGPNAIRAALKLAIDAGESQRQIALRAGIDPSRISRFLAGKDGLTEDTLAKLAIVLK
jgi:hypothetical protein